MVLTGGTGYLGTSLAKRLLTRGHHVRLVVRAATAGRAAPGAELIVGNALDSDSIASALHAGDTLVHLVGTAHPNPAKAAEFEAVDLASVRAAVDAAARAAISHLVYVSVAQPAPVMRAYVAARAAAEVAIAGSGVRATILRPWYVVGPGHRWPLILTPLYALAASVPHWREAAERLGLVSLEQMTRALVRAIEEPPASALAVVEVPGIRAAG
ncbi:NAD(P)H-binding protein [Accumulibacter sp.]|uniref:NAD-dependent epimerase/dehydratase family protein n=1 Tax=Accumulibacter sp. TaxID=2053492 RepID=UPI0025E67159|nr:NAD(P)H-binding protein [Accumulibacter sp.]MCM8611947.1 NAD(P)H-binding protein [Accumulibacter sp.]MCM8635569.1 NAD(P)H-binding protein [Accumulibacter sp.]